MSELSRQAGGIVLRHYHFSDYIVFEIPFVLGKLALSFDYQYSSDR